MKLEFKKIDVNNNMSLFSSEYNKFLKERSNRAKALGLPLPEYKLLNPDDIFTGVKYIDDGEEFRQGYKYIIYALTKPGCNRIYIGLTSISLQVRWSWHLKQKLANKNHQIEKNLWFDRTCNINFIMLTDDINDEKRVIDTFIKNGYNLLNKYIYLEFNDPEAFAKSISDRQREINMRPEIIEYRKKYNSSERLKKARNEYQKTSPTAKSYRQGYYKWYRSAKAEGLTVNEYKKKYNLN